MAGHALPFQEFGKLLRAARAERQLSVRDLAKLSDVSFSLISALETGRRSAGPLTLKKLATALHLRGRDREHFNTLGSDTSGRRRVRGGQKSKGMQLLRDLVAVLAGVEHEDIDDILIEYRSPNTHFAYDFVIRLRNGSLLAGEIKRDQIWIIPSDPTTAMLPAPAAAGKPALARVIKIPARG